jgi:alcohol dehydrogenase class IV
MVSLVNMGRNQKIALSACLVAALWGKRLNRNAGLMWLVKRFVGALLGRVLPFGIPKAVSGVGSSGGKIVGELATKGCKRPLIVTDEMLVKHGLVQPCLDSLKSAGMEYQLFDAVVPNPHTELVEQGYELYQTGQCDCIIAFGGGSPMDCAKVIGAKVANPQPIKAYQGYFNVNMFGLKPLPPLIAVPTTAGTGSETTVAAIITLKQERKKLAIADLGLIPSVAVFDPQILAKLPPQITAATGMDALTHAVESYIGGWSTSFTRKMSLQATEKIFKNLLTTYNDGSDLQAREHMLTASYEAGLAFTRANVGYVHAIAHQLGGMFHTPHGDANAMLLPHVLAFYLEDEQPGMFSVTPLTEKLCDLAIAAGLHDLRSSAPYVKSELAQQFVTRIREMNAKMKLPAEVPTMKASDVADVVSRALAEAHGTGQSLWKLKSYLFDLGYPVPKYMTPKDCATIVAQVLPADEKRLWLSQQNLA